MEVQFGPNPADEPNLLYKLQRKIKVFNTGNNLPNRGYNLVTSSSKYGIVFIGTPEGTLSVYQLKELIDKECEPKHFGVKLPEKPTHVAVSCDQELLATTGGQLLCVYKVADFQNVNVAPAVSISCNMGPSTFVSALQWNPCIPDNIAIAFFDGTLLVSSVTTSQIKKVQSKARCICWSPKGKQLVTGNSDGSLCQYKPDLTLAKTVPPPNLFQGAPVEALAIYWISTFQFAVVFRNAADNSRPAVTIVNTPKAGQPSCFNYEDVCYSMGTNRPWYYYLLGLAQWNIILASSSNSMEIATLGSADGTNWSQWSQSDEARPELPLTDKKQENYPVGISIDTCAAHQLPWGENETLPYMPLLHVVSQSGLLTIFNIINLNKSAVQVCTPPQQQQALVLPANALTSDIPDDAPAQVTLPPPPSVMAAPKPQPQPVAQPPPTQPAQPAFGASQLSSLLSSQQKPFSMPQPQQSIPSFTPAAIPQVPQPKPVEPKPQPVPQQIPPVQKPPQAQVPKPQATQPPEVNAALKAEQERVNKLKADQELKNMLVKEVNDFQTELYKFAVKTRETQIKLQQDLNSMDANFNFQQLTKEQLNKECDLEDLRGAIVQLKLELVRACAVVAEARTHAEAKDLNQWTQTDPLTTKRVSSVKKLAYYVQTQLELAHKALDYKWNEMLAKDPQSNKGQYMIRPVLDSVYQPLVKQQEILSRQQAVLRTLRDTLTHCATTPLQTKLLRTTPLRSKDPLSKLTKNILNMSIEPQTTKPREGMLTPQKLDALRDLLSNHKPTKIKPVNVELRQHLAQIRLSYERSIKKEAQETKQVPVKTEPMPSQPVKVETAPQVRPTTQPVQFAAQPNTIKPDLISKTPVPLNIPSFTPVNAKTQIPGLTNVARTLFTEEPSKPTPQQPQMKPQQSFGFGTPPTSITASESTRSILKDMLQNKQANAALESKNDANTFLGQKICSPTAFAFSSVQQPTAPAPTLSFTSKPISDINNMFNKFTPQAFTAEPKPQAQITKTKSEETGERDTDINKAGERKKEEKPATSLFQTKPLAATAQNVPDVLKTNAQAVKTEKVILKAKAPEKSKENVPEISKPIATPVVAKPVESDKKDEGLRPFNMSANKSNLSMFGAAATSTPIASVTAVPIAIPKPAEIKPEAKAEPKAEPKVEAKPESKPEIKPETAKEEKPAPVTSPVSSASSIFASANSASPTATKPQPVFASSPPASPSEDTKPTKEKEPTSPTSPTISASSLFGAAASQNFPKTTQSGSIFSTSPTSSAFGGSIFGSTTTQSSPAFGTSTTQSVFASSEAKPSVFSTPTPASPTVFGSPTTTSQSVFGTSGSSVFAATTTQSTFSSGPVFGTSTTSPSTVFGSMATTTLSVFGATTTTAQSVFGSATTTTQSVFGSTTSPSLFGSAATTQSAVFGSQATTAQSIFGTATATTAQSVFGTATATTQASVFGSPTTTVASIFGSGTPTTQSSVFGATTQASVFGSPQSSQASVFGTATTTQASVFGTPTVTTQASVFVTATATTQASVFGTATATTQASVFGTPPSSQASVFGSQPTTTASGSLFGDTGNLFAAASISTTSAGSPTSGGNVFGGNIFGGGSSSSTTSVFGGGNTNVFGSKATFSQSNPQAAAIFGGAAASAGFGQKPNNNLWAGGSSSGGSVFGTNSGFGQQATTQPSSIFGGSTGGSFSAPSGGQPFGSPQQTSVFGSPQQQTTPAFGGSSAFGAKPAFGQSAAFGSPTGGAGFGGFNKSPSSGFGAAPAFGGGATFGGAAFGGSSPGKVFGGTAPAPNFGTTQSNATFEALANQSTLTFGNLAQQSPPAQQAPTFNTSPSFTGWRG